MSKKLLSILVVAIILFIVIVALMLYKENQSAPKLMRIPTVSVMTVESSDYTDKLSALGHIESINGAILKATASGRITKVNVKSGQEVKKGDVLIEINPESTIASLEYNAAQIKLDKGNLQRYQTLFKKKAISEEELDTAQATYDKDIAQKKVYLADLNNEIIRAPFDGKLGVVHPKLGEYINIADELFSLQNLKPIHVNFALPSKLQSQVQLGQVVEVSLDAYKDKLFQGKVTAIDNIIQKNSNSLLVRGELANSKKELLPGDLVNVELVINTQKDVIIIPSEAVVYEDGKSYVYTVDDNKVNKVSVELGKEVGENDIIITTGIKVGDKIVSAGGNKLANGMQVKVAD
ncbi:efflux RND transporter periplasmic adaptor subunit [Thiotrichales bacterium 19S3-7]|nr:efflux RND transporter periplasmic adaptor subunit [Thiotrichales bacterium 19S3-7]MCF6802902.1 efflux RND transporter periplasmic adaptor subunit [Thiotrichales bacterium 19S3-11]